MSSEGELQNSLRATRTRLGMSQQRLADMAGVTRQTIGGIESHLYAPSASVALRLARALGCRVEDLFWLEEDLPTIQAAPAGEITTGQIPEVADMRLALAQVNGRWIAHSLTGDAAFRTEMVPADGIGRRDGAALSVRLLDEPEKISRTVVIAGCTPALSLWARSAERWQPALRIHWTHLNSMAALESLARGEVHAAGVHLRDPLSGTFNTPFVRRVLPGQAVVLINLGIWEEGFLMNPGRMIQAAADLAAGGMVLVNREEGSGARLILDSALEQSGITPQQVQGYDRVVSTHQDVAQAVSAGHADVGVSTASMAAAYGLAFLPLQSVRYDLAIRAEALQHEPLRQFLDTLHHRWVRIQLRVVGGYDTSSTGEMVDQTEGSELPVPSGAS